MAFRKWHPKTGAIKASRGRPRGSRSSLAATSCCAPTSSAGRVLARENSLLVHQVEDEVVVYDRTRKQAHRLNEAAAKVWDRLDGEKTVSEVTGEIDVDESVVALAVDDLAKAQLLESSEALSVSRRNALRRVASVAAVGFLLPAVTSIAAPLAAEAKSGCDPTVRTVLDLNCLPTTKP